MTRIGIVFGDTVIMSAPSACTNAGQAEVAFPISERDLVDLVSQQDVKVAQCLSAAKLLLGVADSLHEQELTVDRIIESTAVASIPAQNVTPLRSSCYGGVGVWQSNRGHRD